MRVKSIDPGADPGAKISYACKAWFEDKRSEVTIQGLSITKTKRSQTV
jgi:hypothetical protein